MEGFFMRDTFEDAVVQKVRKLDDKQLAAIASTIFKAQCEIARPDEGDFIVMDIERCPELKKHILDMF